MSGLARTSSRTCPPRGVLGPVAAPAWGRIETGGWLAQLIFRLLAEFNYPGWQSVGTSTPYRSRKGSTLIF